MDVISCAHLSALVNVHMSEDFFCFYAFPLLSVCLCTVHTLYVLVYPCSGGEYLAVLRQDHRLGVAELLLDTMLGVMGLGISIADRHRAQVIRGGGTLHALQGG